LHCVALLHRGGWWAEHWGKDLIREYHGYSAVSAGDLTILACFQEDPGRPRLVIETRLVLQKGDRGQ
jgi:hypothetical protein